MNRRRARGIVQGVFLLGFFLLLTLRRMQAWVILLGLGLLLGVFWGRVYCGWVCPMGTVMRFETWIYQKFGIKRKAPGMKHENGKNRGFVKILQLLFLVMFFGGMITTQRLGIRVNLIVILVGFGVGVSLFTKEEFWHRICPHGAVMSLTAKIKGLKLKKMTVEKEGCIGCGQCDRVCPNLSITADKDGKTRRIITKDCLVCFECEKVCPTNAIYFR